LLEKLVDIGRVSPLAALMSILKPTEVLQRLLELGLCEVLSVRHVLFLS
jgi:hypothetical protein